jgi:hypothetical protein
MEKFGIWIVILGGIFLFRLFRWLLRGDGGAAARAKSTARMNAAAKRILEQRRDAPALSTSNSSNRAKSSAKMAKPPKRPKQPMPAARSAILQPRRRSAVIRFSTPVTNGTGVVQRRR